MASSKFWASRFIHTVEYKLFLASVGPSFTKGLSWIGVQSYYKLLSGRHLQIGVAQVRKYSIVGVKSVNLQYREMLVTKTKNTWSESRR